MADRFGTIVVPTAVATVLRRIAQIRGHDTDGMFVKRLSATGLPPATHFISSGFLPQAFALALTNPTQMKAIIDAAAAEQGIASPYTLAQVTNALNQCDVTQQAPDEVLARLGLQRILRVKRQ